MAKKDKELVEEEKISAKGDKSAKSEKTAEKKPAKNGRADKNKKPNIFVRIGRKLKETFSELKRVTWPTLPKALKATGVVVVVVLIFTVLVTAFNYGFGELLKLLTSLGG